MAPSRARAVTRWFERREDDRATAETVHILGAVHTLQGVATPATLMADEVQNGASQPVAGRCGAKLRGKNRYCKRMPMDGQRRCDIHGGKTPAALRAAQERLALARAGELLGIPKQVDPAQALLDAVCEAAGNVEFLRQQVQLLQLRHDVPLASTDAAGTLRMDVALQLYNSERDRLADFARLAVNAGVAERHVRIAEHQGAMLAAIVAALLSDPGMGLTPQQQALGRQVAARLLANTSTVPALPAAH